MAPRRVSRLWVRRYERPRTARGSFMPGWTLYTRHDGASRWIRPQTPDSHRDAVQGLSAAQYRALRDLLVFVVAAALVFWL